MGEFQWHFFAVNKTTKYKGFSEVTAAPSVSLIRNLSAVFFCSMYLPNGEGYTMHLIILLKLDLALYSTHSLIGQPSKTIMKSKVIMNKNLCGHFFCKVTAGINKRTP